MTRLGGSPRTRVRRIPEKAVLDVEVMNAVLDAGLVGHVAVVDQGQPFVLPVGYARDGDHVLFHGSSKSRLFMSLATGAPTCFTVTMLDGLVLARSAFESSMHYRSVMVLGHCTRLEGEQKARALRVISDHLLPDRWEQIREPSVQELKATIVLSLPLEECSVKIADGPPDDVPSDVDRPVWAGVVPIVERFGEPVDAPDLIPDTPVPDYVRNWTR